MIYTIENDLLKISVKDEGSFLTSIYDKKENKELLYQPDKRSWAGQDVVIFPFVARFKNALYKVDGKTYSLKNHGLIRYNTSSLKYQDKTNLILEFNASEETLKLYPYKFHFEVKYELNGNRLSISYKILNTDDKPIYFEFGGHPALRTSGIETETEFKFKDTILEFERPLELERYVLDNDGNYILRKEKTNLPKIINIDKEFILKDQTLIYDAKDIKKVILKTNGNTYLFDVSRAQFLALWCVPGFGDFICVEPWWGIPDYDTPNPELKDKPFMHKLEANKTEESGYSITIN